MAAFLFRPASPAIERAAALLALALALTVLLAPADGWSWLPALAGLLFAAWPLALAERALAVRAGRPLLAGFQALTREADAHRAWRVIAWSSLGASLLALVLTALLAGLLATSAVQTLAGSTAGLHAGGVLWPVLTVATLLLSFLRAYGHAPSPVWLLPAALLAGWHVAGQQSGNLPPVLADLPLPVALPAAAGLLFGALLLGTGLGAHWQQSDAGQQRLPLAGRGVVLLVGLGLVALLLTGRGSLPVLLLGYLATLLALDALARPALAAVRGLNLPPLLAPLLVLVPVVVAAEAVWYFAGAAALDCLTFALAVWMAVNMLLLALFAGWVMKISHVRKALQLPSEGLYNVWRIAVRWVAPVTLLIALWRLLPQ